MNSRLTALVSRRELLVRRSRSRRTELGAIAGQVCEELRAVDFLLGAVQSLRRSGTLLGVAAAAVAVVGPGKFLRTAPRLLRFAPLALSVYDLFRHRENRRR